MSQTKFNITKDYYKILRVTKHATHQAIKESFKKLVLEYHPDKEGGDIQKYMDVIEAKEVLTDPESRAAYNSYYYVLSEAKQFEAKYLGKSNDYINELHGTKNRDVIKLESSLVSTEFTVNKDKYITTASHLANFKINAGGGDDKIFISDPFYNLKIKEIHLGSGNDIVYLGNKKGGTTIYCEGGANKVVLSSSFAGKFNLPDFLSGKDNKIVIKKYGSFKNNVKVKFHWNKLEVKIDSYTPAYETSLSLPTKELHSFANLIKDKFIFTDQNKLYESGLLGNDEFLYSDF